MAFHSPVHIGDLVTVQAEVTWVGRSSMETKVVVTAERVITGETTHTNTAYFVYVALGEDGRPIAVPPPCVKRTLNEKIMTARPHARHIVWNNEGRGICKAEGKLTVNSDLAW